MPTGMGMAKKIGKMRKKKVASSEEESVAQKLRKLRGKPSKSRKTGTEIAKEIGKMRKKKKSTTGGITPVPPVPKKYGSTAYYSSEMAEAGERATKKRRGLFAKKKRSKRKSRRA